MRSELGGSVVLAAVGLGRGAAALGVAAWQSRRLPLLHRSLEGYIIGIGSRNTPVRLLREKMVVQCHEAKMTHEKIEILNYDTSIHGEHVFRLDGTPGV